MAQDQQCSKCRKIFPKKIMVVMANKSIVCPDCAKDIEKQETTKKQQTLFLPPHHP